MAIPKEREAPILERHYFPKGSHILREGEVANNAYLILAGEVTIFTDKNEKRLTIASLDAGEVFGEMALFSKSPRGASAMAKTDCNLLVLTRPVLLEKMRGTDPTIQAMFKMLMDRVSAGNQAMTEHDSAVGMLSSSVNELFAQALSTLPADKQKSFKKQVQPVLRDFIRAVEGFSL